MLNNELNRAESIPDIHYFDRHNKYNRKVNKEIKKLEVLESLLV
jgi:superoxide dismutase